MTEHKKSRALNQRRKLERSTRIVKKERKSQEKKKKEQRALTVQVTWMNCPRIIQVKEVMSSRIVMEKSLRIGHRK